jgi:hypothetical protein
MYVATRASIPRLLTRSRFYEKDFAGIYGESVIMVYVLSKMAFMVC